MSISFRGRRRRLRRRRELFADLPVSGLRDGKRLGEDWAAASQAPLTCVSFCSDSFGPVVRTEALWSRSLNKATCVG